MLKTLLNPDFVYSVYYHMWTDTAWKVSIKDFFSKNK